MSETPKQSEAPSSPSSKEENSRASLGKAISRFVKRRMTPEKQPAANGFIHQPKSADEAPVSIHERKLLTNILKLRDIRADHVMIPRADIIAVDIDISRDDLMALLSEKQFSRLPVFRNTLDDVIGTIHIKDIIACIAKGEEINIRNHISDIPIVSPAMPIIDLLQTMQKSSRHIVLIVDEYGGIDGLVTIGDIIESIVGEIDDEHDNGDEPKLTESTDGSIVADGRFDVEQFENIYGMILSDEERAGSDTLGGLVCAIAGRVPARGEVLTHFTGVVFEVLDADPRRVYSLRIRNIDKSETA